MLQANLSQYILEIKRAQSAIDIGTLSALKNWFIAHITGDDKAFADYYHNRGLEEKNKDRGIQMDTKSYTDNIQMHVKSGNYHAALNLALSGLNECRRNDDQTGVDNFLGIIKDITQTLVNEFGSKE